MPKKFDVIIVGAGPAGAECARQLSKLGRKVLVIERSMEIGHPNFSSAGTPVETLANFDLPKDLVGGEWSEILIAVKDKIKTWDFGKPRGYVLDFSELKKFLIKEAAENGAEVLIGTAAKEPILKDDYVVGVKHSGIFGEGEAYGDIIVDASGPAGAIVSQIGLREKIPCPPSGSAEFLFINCPEELSKSLSFYFGSPYVDKGYGWIFPMGDGRVKAGVAVYVETPGLNITNVLIDFVGKLPQLEKATIVDLHGASVYITAGIKKHNANGFLVIGDAASQINPLAGEGIRHAMTSARIATEVIDQALEAGDFGEKKLSPFNKKWKDYVGQKWKHSLLVARKIYSGNEALLDTFMNLISDFSKEEIFDVAFNYDFKKILKIKGTLKWLESINMKSS